MGTSKVGGTSPGAKWQGRSESGPGQRSDTARSESAPVGKWWYRSPALERRRRNWAQEMPSALTIPRESRLAALSLSGGRGIGSEDVVRSCDFPGMTTIRFLIGVAVMLVVMTPLLPPPQPDPISIKTSTGRNNVRLIPESKVFVLPYPSLLGAPFFRGDAPGRPPRAADRDGRKLTRPRHRQYQQSNRPIRALGLPWQAVARRLERRGRQAGQRAHFSASSASAGFINPRRSLAAI